ncbi:type II secretion system F family protein [Wenzhouxiangella marina]|uniref:General secretion pathway protein F n=1 Tax=Wenzhouxiangella marina TaxID=1579979 RepID=A0A0K0XX52_9GAMM|nr:type II secretion system F family protein [Wenzhouxiangella marina]AKS42263.1 General secretion pathway protein F [Wenzhouxiangella marina]MBB6085964.1 general secretion pathway protein F [Wenzhouxiangella marina]
MAAFEYQALDGQHTARGVIQADNARAARAQLRERGLIPLDIQQVETQSKREFSLRSQGRERALVLRQLATLLRAGLTLEEVLGILVEQTDASAQRRQLGAIRSRVMEGQSLSSAMAEHPALFPALYSASVAAGERAGQIDRVLARLADYAEQREETARGVSLALIYPALLAIIAVGVVWGLIGFVVPRVAGVFETAGQELPDLTLSLLAISGLISNHGLWLLLGLIGAGFGLLLLWRSPGPRLAIDRRLLALPVIGRLTRARQTASFTRTLAILTNSAVPLVEALKVAARVVENHQVQADLERAAGQVREGQSLSASLHSAAWLPPMARRLIAGGERSGELAPMLEHAADIQERELQSATTVMLAVLQPALILAVGLMVLYIVLAIMLPILNMSQLLS